jgi:hypothetical protein
MTEPTKAQEGQLSDDQLSEVAGGAGNIQQQRLEHLDNQSKSDGKVEDIQSARLEQLDSHDSSK